MTLMLVVVALGVGLALGVLAARGRSPAPPPDGVEAAAPGSRPPRSAGWPTWRAPARARRSSCVRTSPAPGARSRRSRVRDEERRERETRVLGGRDPAVHGARRRRRRRAGRREPAPRASRPAAAGDARDRSARERTGGRVRAVAPRRSPAADRLEVERGRRARGARGLRRSRRARDVGARGRTAGRAPGAGGRPVPGPGAHRARRGRGGSRRRVRGAPARARGRVRAGRRRGAVLDGDAGPPVPATASPTGSATRRRAGLHRGGAEPARCDGIGRSRTRSRRRPR